MFTNNNLKISLVVITTILVNLKTGMCLFNTLILNITNHTYNLIANLIVMYLQVYVLACKRHTEQNQHSTCP